MGRARRKSAERRAKQTGQLLRANIDAFPGPISAKDRDSRYLVLMQFQADLLGVPVIRPQVAETTSLGAGYAAGLATGFWNEVEDLRENWVEDKRWEPSMDESQRDEYYQYWKKAVTRTFDWFEADQA